MTDWTRNRGKMPNLRPDTWIEVRYRDKSTQVFRFRQLAQGWEWAHDKDDTDIMAWRRIRLPAQVWEDCTPEQAEAAKVILGIEGIKPASVTQVPTKASGPKAVYIALAVVAAIALTFLAVSSANAEVIGTVETDGGAVRLTDQPCQDKQSAVAYHVDQTGKVTGGCWSIDEFENKVFVQYQNGQMYLYSNPVFSGQKKDEQL
jgi:hypothetical protein